MVSERFVGDFFVFFLSFSSDALVIDEVSNEATGLLVLNFFLSLEILS